MAKKTDIKMVAIVAVGVMVAGFAMNMLSDIGAVRDAQRGFGG